MRVRRRASARTIEALVNANLGLVYSVVGSLSHHRGFDYDELVSEGMMALMNASAYFDKSRGFAFSTYAHRAIERACWRALGKSSARVLKFGTGGLDALEPYLSVETGEEVPEHVGNAFVQGVVNGLPDHQRRAIRHRFGVRRKRISYRNVGRKYRISAYEARQNCIAATEVLRRVLVPRT